jgi:hypothetical protein
MDQIDMEQPGRQKVSHLSPSQHHLTIPARPSTTTLESGNSNNPSGSIWEKPPGMCTKCETKLGTWQCLECFSASSLCSQCCANMHWHHPYHRVPYWSGSYYQPSWLFHTRLKIHIGHDGEPCPYSPHNQPVSPTEPQSLPFPTPENLEEEVIVQDIANLTDLGEDPDWIDVPEEPAVPSHLAADHQGNNPFLNQTGQTGSISTHCNPSSTLPQAAKPTPIRLPTFCQNI